MSADSYPLHWHTCQQFGSSTPQEVRDGREAADCKIRALCSSTLRGRPHGNAFVCKRTLCIVCPIGHTDPVNALFWNLVSGWKNPKTLPSRSCVISKSAYFAIRWCHRPTHRPLAFNLLTLQRLITTTMVDYMLVFMLQKISSLSGLLGQNILLLCHHVERKWILDNRLPTDHFRLLVVFGFSIYCLFVYSRKHYAHAPSLPLRFWWISSATYRPGIWATVFWVVFSGSVWTQIFLKWCQGRQGNKRSFWYVWTRPEPCG